jgi:Mg-chelatase subunit ChlD
LRAFERVQHGKISIVYALDASGSMRGKKISTAKKAGVALAFRAIQDRNDVGLLVFTNEVTTSIPPTKDFSLLLEALANTRAGHETDIALSISHAIKLFDNGAHTKHLIILTDAIPTTGKDPLRHTLETASLARDSGITISIIGINLEKEGERLAREIVQHGNGKLYKVNALEELDTIILEDYENLKK